MIEKFIQIPEELKNEITEAHKIGIHNKTKESVKNYYEEVKGNPSKFGIARSCLKLMEGIRGVKEERIIITTHAYFLQLKPEFLKAYTIIIDEDILQLQIFNNIYSISMKCLENVASAGIYPYSQIAIKMLQTNENEYKK